MIRSVEILRGDPVAAPMLAYVKDLLAPVDALSKNGRYMPFRSRYAHTERVLERALGFAETEACDIGVVAVASIFHDAGYRYSGDGHARYSAEIFDEYIRRNIRADYQAPAPANAGQQPLAAQTTNPIEAQIIGPDSFDYEASISSRVKKAIMSTTGLNKIHDVISIHSDKHLPAGNLSPEAAVLMDADLLDEAGATSVLFDCFNQAAVSGFNYLSAYKQIKERYDSETDMAALFHTDAGRREFARARGYVGGFIDGLRKELCV